MPQSTTPTGATGASFAEGPTNSSLKIASSANTYISSLFDINATTCGIPTQKATSTRINSTNRQARRLPPQFHSPHRHDRALRSLRRNRRPLQSLQRPMRLHHPCCARKPTQRGTQKRRPRGRRRRQWVLVPTQTSRNGTGRHIQCLGTDNVPAYVSTYGEIETVSERSCGCLASESPRSFLLRCRGPDGCMAWHDRSRCAEQVSEGSLDAMARCHSEL